MGKTMGKLVVGVLAIFTPLMAQAAAGDAKAGKALYTAKCAVCHGERGDGRGKAAYLLFPRPRDFSTGVYKFRTTPSGSLPRDEDIFRTISRGVAGTAMPSWEGELSEQERWDLVAYLKTLSERFAQEAVEEPLAIPPAPARTADDIARGKEVYARMKCADCHGETGKGDGPSAKTLKDDDGNRILPYDFTRGGRMKGGSLPADVYRTFSTGLDGTPMPSYLDVLPEEDRWRLVYYVLSLGESAKEVALGGNIVAAKASERPPADPDAAAWQQAPATSLQLRPLWGRSKYPDRLQVQVLYTDEEIAFRLQWEDDTSNSQAIRIAEFRDAAAVMLPLGAAGNGKKGSQMPSITMGDASNPVNLWHWKADWQGEIATPAPSLVYAGMHVDTYMGHEADPTFMTARGVGNTLASQRHRSPVESLLASGFGTLTPVPPELQELDGIGTYRDGSWTVVMRGKIAPKEKGSSADLRGLSQTPVAFAVWDGEENDRDGSKLVTQWTAVVFGGGAPGRGRRLRWW